MDDIQNAPTENTDGIQISDQATEEQSQDQIGADNAPTEEGSQEERVTFTPEQQAIFDKTINKKVAKTHAVTQERDDLQRQLAEAKAQLPQAQAPEIPDTPNLDDFYSDPDGLKAAQDKRDEAIKQRAEFDQQISWENSQLQRQAQQQAQETVQKQQEAIVGYAKTAETFGIKSEQMQKDAAMVSQSGLAQGIQDHLVSDAQGPLIINFLATNMLELDKIRSMDDIQAGIYIANEIKPKLAGIKKTTTAPHPLDMDDGKGVPEKTDPRLKGVTFS